nr:MAG TPA: hypothetical protein [Caudoviricetes sp.]
MAPQKTPFECGEGENTFFGHQRKSLFLLSMKQRKFPVLLMWNRTKCLSLSPIP